MNSYLSLQYSSAEKPLLQVQLGCSFVDEPVADESLPSLAGLDSLRALTVKERMHIILHSMLTDSVLLPSGKNEISTLLPESLWKAFSPDLVA